MNPRGRPFEPGNKLGRGRPKGSRNKTKAAVLQLLEQSQMPVVAQIIRQALQGQLGSQRLLMAVYPTLPRPRSGRSRKGTIRTVEDLVSLAEQALQRMSLGEITAEEAKSTLQAVEQTGQLLKQRSQEHISQRPPKAPLPAFMLEALEAARADHLQKEPKANNEKKGLRRM
jgi:hypothetical protein